MEHNAQRICRPCAWPRGAAFCLGLKIYISPFRAAPGGQVFPSQGLHMRNVKCCISLKSLPYALDDEEPLIPFFLSFF